MLRLFFISIDHNYLDIGQFDVLTFLTLQMTTDT